MDLFCCCALLSVFLMFFYQHKKQGTQNTGNTKLNYFRQGSHNHLYLKQLENIKMMHRRKTTSMLLHKLNLTDTLYCMFVTIPNLSKSCTEFQSLELFIYSYMYLKYLDCLTTSYQFIMSCFNLPDTVHQIFLTI